MCVTSITRSNDCFQKCVFRQTENHATGHCLAGMFEMLFSLKIRELIRELFFLISGRLTVE